MLARTFSVIILILAVLSGAVLLFGAPGSGSTTSKRAGQQAESGVTSLPSVILSRLSMLPFVRNRPVPVAVVIENHEDARPNQKGLVDALMIQEYLVEGFISRFIVLFDARKLPREIGPVRSLRPYFLDGMSAWTRTFFHAGGSPEALARVRNGEGFYALNLLYYDGEVQSLRKEGLSPPHDLFLSKSLFSDLLADVPDHLLKPVLWPPFPTGVPVQEGEPASSVRINFFSATHNVLFEYQPLAEKYERTNGETVSEARPSTVLVLEVPIDSVGEYGRLFMTLEGGGKALVFHSGSVWEGRWSRGNASQSFRITDNKGEEIPMLYGQIWITVLPTLERVSWES